MEAMVAALDPLDGFKSKQNSEEKVLHLFRLGIKQRYAILPILGTGSE